MSSNLEAALLLLSMLGGHNPQYIVGGVFELDNDDLVLGLWGLAAQLWRSQAACHSKVGWLAPAAAGPGHDWVEGPPVPPRARQPSGGGDDAGKEEVRGRQ